MNWFPVVVAFVGATGDHHGPCLMTVFLEPLNVVGVVVECGNLGCPLKGCVLVSSSDLSE